LAVHNYASRSRSKADYVEHPKLDNNPTSRSWPSENSHSSRFADNRLCMNDRASVAPRTIKGKEQNAMHQGSAAHPGFAPKKRYACCVQPVTLRYSSRFDASGRLPWSCNPSQTSQKSYSSVRSGLTAAPQAISPACMQARRYVFVFMTALLDRLEPAYIATSLLLWRGCTR
jgi:hypothetical protein